MKPMKKKPRLKKDLVAVYLDPEMNRWIRDEAVKGRRPLSMQATIVLEAGRKALDEDAHV
ncbi:MAG: hypothetical protein KGP14_07580 [Betaproteobacteria bacterium]|nr:hypothetical protein [Betaproteobacteria bacterium]